MQLWQNRGVRKKLKVLWYATGFPPDRLVCGRETKLSSRVDDPPVSFCSALFACRFFLSYCVLLQPTLTEITQLKIGYGSLEFIFTVARFFFFFGLVFYDSSRFIKYRVALLEIITTCWFWWFTTVFFL